MPEIEVIIDVPLVAAGLDVSRDVDAQLIRHALTELLLAWRVQQRTEGSSLASYTTLRLRLAADEPSPT